MTVELAPGEVMLTVGGVVSDTVVVALEVAVVLVIDVVAVVVEALLVVVLEIELVVVFVLVDDPFHNCDPAEVTGMLVPTIV